MKTLIPINRETIEENPNAGNTTYCLPLKPIVEKDAEGRIISMEQPCQYLHTLTPEPKYFYKHTPTEVTCEFCGATFPHTELKEDYDYEPLDDICPKCGVAFCCELEYERL